jgi:ABC-2 type transport system permease protein
MDFYFVSRPALLAALFIKEQLREPVALFWTVVSPVVTYYLLTYARAPLSSEAVDYLSKTSWFYAFVSSNVALFGLAFYIVGRRESGFLRSFVYTDRTKVVFLIGQFSAYSVVSILYCSVFYMLTRVFSGEFYVAEYLVIVGRFYVCFLLFSIPALLLTLVPLGFQNASTLFSILSLTMLALGIISMGPVSPALAIVGFFNPMWWANKIMLDGVVECGLVFWVVVISLVFLFLVMCRYLLINPVWGRY